jgi:hypothetical protein
VVSEMDENSKNDWRKLEHDLDLSRLKEELNIIIKFM